MKPTITLILASLFLLSCNSVKRNEKFLASGKYDEAIELAVKKIQKGKSSSKIDTHIVLLEEAYRRVVEHDKRELTYLKKSNDPAGSRKIYHLLAGLEVRQQLLRPLLPLYSPSLGRNANIKIVDYTSQIVAAKKDYADYLNAEGNKLLDRNTIMDAREAYTYFCELKDLQSNYFNVDQLMQESHFRGTDFVFVSLNNRSGQIIPRRLERDLLDFNTYGLDDFWTEYHSQRRNDVDYNFGIALNFREIGISPEHISEKEIQRSKKVKDGWKYKLDRNGNVMKDSLGNDIKIDKYIIARAQVIVTEQSKSVLVGGNVVYRDLVARRDINNHPLSTEFIFENLFATYVGDERALTEEDLELLKYKFVRFPSNEQMVLDAGDDIKLRLKDILKNNSFR